MKIAKPRGTRPVEQALADPRFTYEAGDARRFKKLQETALSYVKSLGWVKSIVKLEVGLHVPPILGVFAVQVEPRSKDIEDWHWIVVGDVPPAYLSLEFAADPVEALNAYVAEMEAWCDAVDAGESVDELIPVNVPPTRKWSKELRNRLREISKSILEPLKKNSVECANRPKQKLISN